MNTIKTDLLKQALKDTEARWKCIENEAQEHALGYSPGPDDHPLHEREHVALDNVKQFRALALALAPAPGGPPPGIDWRNHNGADYVTAVENQGQCGSCVAFGSIATVEACERVQKNSPNLAIDLSEADLFFCHHGVTGGTCSTGWYPDAAMTVLQKSGVVNASAFPYTDHQQPCKITTGQPLTHISSWQKLTNTAAMKSWLSTKGPLATCFTVYADFYSYHSGVYHHVSGAVVGGHCVCCVGYNDAGQYWICKNSWASTWGEQGFFRIGYGQCGIDATMWAVQI